jgi:ubiquitin C-terminal hydrolase
MDNTSTPPHRIKNEGNTCYMNSVVQALFSSKHFQDHVSNTTITKDDSELASLFNILFTEMSKSTISQVISLKPLFKVLEARMGDTLELFQENDAMEFLTILLDELAKDYDDEDGDDSISPPAKKRCLDPVFAKLDTLLKKQWLESHKDALSVFTDIVYGQYVIQVRCVKCRFSSHRGEPFVSLDLSLQGDTTLDMMNLMNSAFTCEHVYERECDKNCGKASGIRSSRIWKMPKMLLIHFKRFHGTQKVTTPVTVPHNLNLNSYSLFCDNPNYKLVAIICHVGQLQSGHYFALVKRSNTWYIVDDDMTPQPITDIQPYSRAFYIVVYDNVTEAL